MKLKAFLYLLFIACFSAAFPAYSQVYIDDPCLSDDPPVFTGTPESTLCDDLGTLNCEITITDENRLFSTIGSSLVGKVVCIKVDFFIDSDFSFIDCTVKIDPGVHILVNVPSPIQSAPVALHIEGSKLFACNDLWAGILLGNEARIYTDNSTIEDAEHAIRSNARSYLYISNTTFNRNRVGIQLERRPPRAPYV